MIDIRLIREDPAGVVAALKKKLFDVDFTEFLSWDEDARRLTAEVETLRARRNKVSSEIPQLKKKGENVDALMKEMKEIGTRISSLEADHAAIEQRIHDFLYSLPNMPAEDVAAGGKEANVVVRTSGNKPVFSFQPKDHVTLATSLRLLDYERGAKLGGNGFWVYTGDGALLEWALLSYFIQHHRKAGYQFILPPHLLNYQAGFTAGQFPKFENDVFVLRPAEGAEPGHLQFLLPTAETALVNLHRDEILNESELPRRYFSYTPCYRKEAGGYGSTERGMIRGHQFNKVELFMYTRPQDSDAMLEEMIGSAEQLMQGLGLHYQVSKLAAADCSASMAKTYDIEVWIPSMNVYKEVSSASNAREFQARRGSMRYKDAASGKNVFLHTLNASGLATSRLFPAILEQFQQADGSVLIPQPLQPFMGKDRLQPSA
ncbi:MAG: serine--tRNA ligase [Bdellovibrionota bacterium]|nr:MAG: serine--tRNA ligase [Bdellovibrionota bacterium]